MCGVLVRARRVGLSLRRGTTNQISISQPTSPPLSATCSPHVDRPRLPIPGPPDVGPPVVPLDHRRHDHAAVPPLALTRLDPRRRRSPLTRTRPPRSWPPARTRRNLDARGTRSFPCLAVCSVGESCEVGFGLLLRLPQISFQPVPERARFLTFDPPCLVLSSMDTRTSTSSTPESSRSETCLTGLVEIGTSEGSRLELEGESPSPSLHSRP